MRLSRSEQLAFEQRFGQGAAWNDDHRVEAAGLAAWIARATTSLPVPLSPSDHHVASLAATVSTISTTRRMAALWPISCVSGKRGSGFLELGHFLLAARCETAFLTRCTRSSGSKRFGDVVVSAGLEGLDRGLDRGVAGHHESRANRGRPGAAAAAVRCHRRRHFDVDQGQIETAAGQLLQRLGRRGNGHDFEVFAFEPAQRAKSRTTSSSSTIRMRVMLM